MSPIGRWGGVIGYRPARSRDERGGSGARIALTLVVVVLLAILLVVAPLASRLVQMAISRQREYLADVSSAKLTRNPIGLIHALQRLEASDTNIARKDLPVSALCIAAPKGAFLSGLFSTHPPIPDRIARLRNLGGIAVTEVEMPAPQFPRDADAHPKGPWDASASPTNKGLWG